MNYFLQHYTHEDNIKPLKMAVTFFVYCYPREKLFNRSGKFKKSMIFFPRISFALDYYPSPSNIAMS